MGKIYAAKTNHITNPWGFIWNRWYFHERKAARTGTETCKDCDQQEQNLYRYLSRHGEAELASLKSGIWTAAVYKILLESYCDNRCREVIESDTQFFETAKWMNRGRAGGLPVTAVRTASDFLKEDSVRQRSEKRRLYICGRGLGLYEAYFLGKIKKILRNRWRESDSYCNNYDRWIQYQTYDITEQAERGGVLSVLLETVGIKAGSVSMIRSGKHITVTSGSWLRRFT